MELARGKQSEHVVSLRHSRRIHYCRSEAVIVYFLLAVLPSPGQVLCPLFAACDIYLSEHEAKSSSMRFLMFFDVAADLNIAVPISLLTLRREEGLFRIECGQRMATRRSSRPQSVMMIVMYPCPVRLRSFHGGVGAEKECPLPVTKDRNASQML